MSKINNFEQMEELALRQPKQKVAVAAANSEEVLLGIEEARAKGFVDGYLVGDGDEIKEILSKNNISADSYTIVDVKDEIEAAAKAVSLVRDGTCDLLMKGLVETADFQRCILDKENGLRVPGERTCALVAVECKAVKKMLIMGDVGVNIAPDIATKASILKSSFIAAKALGIEAPKAAVLCAKEKVSDKMPCTEDAAKLTEMANNGEIDCLGGLVEGPISLDIACNKMAAEIKKYPGKIQGDADILLFPDLEAGNIMIKALMDLSGDVRVAGVAMGAKVPLIQTSRGDDHDTKYYSIVLSGLVSQFMSK